MIRDVEYIISKIHKIDGFGETGEHLLRIVRAKEVAQAAPPPEPAPPPEASTPTVEEPAASPQPQQQPSAPPSARASPSLAPQPDGGTSVQARLSTDFRALQEGEEGS
jgi:vacuolar protein sorting-associated protein 54